MASEYQTTTKSGLSLGQWKTKSAAPMPAEERPASAPARRGLDGAPYLRAAKNASKGPMESEQIAKKQKSGLMPIMPGSQVEDGITRSSPRAAARSMPGAKAMSHSRRPGEASGRKIWSTRPMALAARVSVKTNLNRNR